MQTNTEAIIIIKRTFRGVYRERVFICRSLFDVLNHAKAFYKQTSNAFGLVILVPQENGPLRWTMGK